MNKYIILFGSACLCLGSAYTLPIAFRNPTSNNLLISGAITSFAVLGIVMFFRQLRTKDIAIAGMTPSN